MEREIYEFSDEELIYELKTRGNIVTVKQEPVRGLSDQKLKELGWDINPVPIPHWCFDEQQYDAVHKMVTPKEVLVEIKRRDRVKLLEKIIG